MDRLVCYTAVFSGKERCVTTLRTAVYIRLWIGLLPFFKGSLTWENNAIFSSHCFTLRQHLNSTINSERDRNLKPLKTDIWFDIYSFISLLLFNKNDTWHPTNFIVQTTGFNRPAKFLILLKHWGYNNFELNWFHGLSKGPAIPFSQVSADSFRFVFWRGPRFRNNEN